MAIELIWQNPNGKESVYTALSSDTLPTNCGPGSTAHITDQPGTLKIFDGLSWVQTRTKGASDVNPLPGPRTNPLILAVSNVGATNQTTHVPAGRSITYINVLCTLNAAPGVAGGNPQVKGVVCIDADSDLFATTATNSGAAIPSSTTEFQQFWEIPLGVWTPIPLTAALSRGTNSTGRLDYRSSSTTVNVDFQFALS